MEANQSPTRLEKIYHLWDKGVKAPIDTTYRNLKLHVEILT